MTLGTPFGECSLLLDNRRQVQLKEVGCYHPLKTNSSQADHRKIRKFSPDENSKIPLCYESRFVIEEGTTSILFYPRVLYVSNTDCLFYKTAKREHTPLVSGLNDSAQIAIRKRFSTYNCSRRRSEVLR
ncbi:hypothetical protein TNCV_4543831 [Trichonephila clavipes]|nr:hypothetical protein TNCV_4543831 [Trichonephila clavipes]